MATFGTDLTIAARSTCQPISSVETDFTLASAAGQGLSQFAICDQVLEHIRVVLS